MKTYPIGESYREIIEFKVDEERYALVHKVNPQSGSGITKTIIMNQREVLKLHQAIQQALLFDKCS